MPRARWPKERGWGRRFWDRGRPVLIAAVLSVLTSTGSAFGTYLYQQAELAAADHNWRQYFHGYWRACESVPPGR